MRSLPQSTAQPRWALYLRPRHALSFSKPQASSSPAPPTAKMQLTAGALHLFRGTAHCAEVCSTQVINLQHRALLQGKPPYMNGCRAARSANCPCRCTPGR